MTVDIREWLAAQGRTRFVAGDAVPSDVRTQIDDLVAQYRTARGLPIVGLRWTAQDANAALEWEKSS